MNKKIIVPIFIFFLIQTQQVKAEDFNTFNLAGVIENIINYQNKSDFITDVKDDAKEQFLYASKNLNNGNIVVAYSEFLNTINSLDKNIALFMLSEKLYNCGFFSLADVSLSKISGKNKMQKQIDMLKNTYKPFFGLTKDEENYLAKTYSLILYNNSPEEAAFNLIKKTALLENSDYANYIMALSMYQCRQYRQALIYVNKAIEKNSVNSNYKLFKAKILVGLKKDKEALKYIESIENEISFYLSLDLKILKQQVLSNLSVNDTDKKFYQIYAYYLSQDHYKVIKETKNILTFYKNNYKILTLQALSYLSLGDSNKASELLNLSYSQNKKFNLTLMGLGDCYFINKDYKKAFDFYKKLLKTEFNNEAILKSCLALEHIEGEQKKLEKFNKLKENFEDKIFFEYYKVANDLFYNDEKNQNKYIAKSLGINMLNKNSWDVLFNFDLKNNNFENMEKISFLLLFKGDMDNKFYYYSALLSDFKGEKKEAYHNVKKSISLNADYKPAIDLLNKLEEELI